MEIADVDRRARAEDHAVRIHEVDVLAARDRAVDLRGIAALHDVQIVVGICPAVIAYGLAAVHGIVRPCNDIVHVRRGNIRHISDGLIDRRPSLYGIPIRGRGKGDLRDQKCTRKPCEQRILHTPPEFKHPIFAHVALPLSLNSHIYTYSVYRIL